MPQNRHTLSLRTDTGGLALICVFLNYSEIIIARILCDTSYERYLFSLSRYVVIRRFRQKILKVEIQKRFFHFYFLNKDF